MRFLIANPPSSIMKAVFLFWLLAKLMSYTLWVDDRLFPIVPVFYFLGNTSSIVHYVFYFSSVVLLGYLTFYRPRLLLLLLLFFIEMLSCSLDLNRWQPWQFQYLSMLYVFILCFNNSNNLSKWLSIILFFTYLYSGLHKLNTHFINGMWQQTILGDFLQLNAEIIKNFKLIKLGYLLPLVETLAALGLLFKKYQKKAAIILIAMHIMLLIILGPLGINYNTIVWPWNIAMIIILYLLFIKKYTVVLEYNLRLQPKFMIILILWGIMPLFNFIGKWPNYLSSNLYSGKAMGLIINIKNASQLQNHPLSKFRNVTKDNNYSNKIYLQYWALKEMNVPHYPEWQVYKIITKQLKLQYNNTVNFTIYNTSSNDSLTNILNTKL